MIHFVTRCGRAVCLDWTRDADCLAPLVTLKQVPTDSGSLTRSEKRHSQQLEEQHRVPAEDLSDLPERGDRDGFSHDSIYFSGRRTPAHRYWDRVSRPDVLPAVVGISAHQLPLTPLPLLIFLFFIPFSRLFRQFCLCSSFRVHWLVG